MQDIIVLNIKFHFDTEEEIIHPVVLRDDKNTVLIDCGFAMHLDALEKALHKENIKLQDIDKVLITHHDYDHIGCLKELKTKSPKTKILASKKEADCIQGKKEALRLQQAKILKNILEEKQKEDIGVFIRNIEKIEKVNVDETIKDGDIVPVCGGCTVLETPGHTAGHLSFYLKDSSIVITGDAACKRDNMLCTIENEVAFDTKQAGESFDKLLNLDAENYICYHGGIYNSR